MREKKNPGYSGGSVSSLSADASVQVLASDARGMTLELATKSFDVTPVEAGGEAFERLRVPAYVHGFTLEPGLPQVPLKGMLLDIPAGKQARVTVLDEVSRTLSGYRVYPAPVYQAGANNQVAEVFSWNEAAYRENAYYPAVAAELSNEYVFRGQAQQRLLFYPLRFNPATGELLHSERIRVRVEFVEASAAAASAGGQLRRGGLSSPACGHGLVDPGGGGLQGEHRRRGDLSDHQRLSHGAGHCRCGHRCHRFVPGAAVQPGSRAGDPHLRRQQQQPPGRRRQYHVLRHGRCRGVCEVRQVQRVLADRCGQRKPPAHAEHRWRTGRRAIGGLARLHGALRAGPGLPAELAGAGCDGPLAVPGGGARAGL